MRIALVTPMLPVPHDQTRGRYIHETARSLGRLATVKTLADLRALLDTLPQDVPFPKDAEGPRGRQGTPGKVVLPDGWLDDPWEADAAAMPGAETENSGG